MERTNGQHVADQSSLADPLLGKSASKSAGKSVGTSAAPLQHASQSEGLRGEAASVVPTSCDSTEDSGQVSRCVSGRVAGRDAGKVSSQLDGGNSDGLPRGDAHELSVERPPNPPGVASDETTAPELVEARRPAHAIGHAPGQGNAKAGFAEAADPTIADPGPSTRSKPHNVASSSSVVRASLQDPEAAARTCHEPLHEPRADAQQSIATPRESGSLPSETPLEGSSRSSSRAAIATGEPPEPTAWQGQLRDAVRQPQQLRERLGEGARAQMTPASDPFPLLVPHSFVDRMRPGDPHDPLLRQVLPDPAELAATPGFDDDPVADADALQQPGMLQKYPGRVLLVVSGACAVHCRYCFRRAYPYQQIPQGDQAWTPALESIATDPSIREVIYSGGDPLVLADSRLARLTARVAAIAHVRSLRVHTRVPIVLPARVTDDLIAWLTGTRLTPTVVLHVNHARELSDEVAEAVERLRREDVRLLNQAVLLRGVNDSVAALEALSYRLWGLGVTPYYLHQLDRIRGAAHFEVPVQTGRWLIEQLRGRLPGYLVPRYVQETPGAASKTPLA